MVYSKLIKKTIVTALFVVMMPLMVLAAEPYVATIGEDGYQVVEVEGGEYFFKPEHIVVQVNVPVKLVMKKTSFIVPHNIVLDAPEAGVRFKVDFGRDGLEIYFIPKKTGVYPFHCDKKLLFFKSHKEKGMEGKLEVVDDTGAYGR
jgi:plastocyanin domain-containing protein